MTLTLPFDVPFSDCEKCIALDPIVQRTEWKIENGLPVCKTRYSCKGEQFCRNRRLIQEDEDGD